MESTTLELIEPTTLTTLEPTTSIFPSNNTGEIEFYDYFYDYPEVPEVVNSTDNEDQRDQKLPRIPDILEGDGIPEGMSIDDMIDYIFGLNQQMESEFDKMDENVEKITDEFDKIDEDDQFLEKPTTTVQTTTTKNTPKFARPSEKVSSVMYHQQWNMEHMCPETRNMMACCATDSPCCKFSGGKFNFAQFQKNVDTVNGQNQNSIGSMSLGSLALGNSRNSMKLPPIQFPNSGSNLFSGALQSRIVGGDVAKSDLRKHMAYKSFLKSVY